MRKRNIILLVGGAILLLLVIIIACIAVQNEGKLAFISSYYTSCTDEHPNKLQKFSTAAISSDASPCASIAKEMLERGGTAADATVAAVFCIGIINGQSAGLGGGFLATYYSKADGRAYSLDSREVAPSAATKDMYMDPPKKGRWWDKKMSASYKGGLSVAVPGESAGLYELYKRFGGKIAWKDLIEPSIKLCEEGIKLTWYTGGILDLVKSDILHEPTISELLVKENGNLKQKGDVVKRPILAKTLRALQRNPYELLNGTLAKRLAEDIQGFDGIVTEEDLANYKPVWRTPMEVSLQNGGYTVHSFPPPGSGLVVGLMLNILDNYNLTAEDLKDEETKSITYHRITEAFKFTYARRSQLGDLPEAKVKEVINSLTDEALAFSLWGQISDEKTYNNIEHYGARDLPPGDEGTAHFSLVASNGDAVALTGSINYAYGAGIRSKSTGIILNNEMADFTTNVMDSPDDGKVHYNTNNFVVPGNRPLSSMSPTIVLDKKGEVRLVLGAAGGMRIPSAIAWVAARNLWMAEDLKQASDSCRLHHQLEPMELKYDVGFPREILNRLEDLGHKTKQLRWKSVVVAVARDQEGMLETTYDFRKSGEVDGL